jgi:hypothetical protein
MRRDKMRYGAKFIFSAAVLTTSALQAQSSRDVTRIPPELAKPLIATLCPYVRAGTEEALASVSGAVTELGILGGTELRITVSGWCFREKPSILQLFVAPASLPRGSVPPKPIATSIPVESWNSGSATFLTKVRGLDWIHGIEPDPIVLLKFSMGTRNFSAVLTEAEFVSLQSGGTITKPPTK